MCSSDLELGEATTEKLISAGIETVQELLGTPLEKLVEIPGIGEKTAEKVRAAAQEYLVAHTPAPPESGNGGLFTPEMEATAAPPAADAAAVEAATGVAPPASGGEAESGEMAGPVSAGGPPENEGENRAQ